MAPMKVGALYETVTEAVGKHESDRFQALHSDRLQALNSDLQAFSKDEDIIDEFHEFQVSNNFLKSPEKKEKGRYNKKRSTMGHYIFDLKGGERPLSVRDLPTPGPSDYQPDYLKSSVITRNPEYSIRPITISGKVRPDKPGPKYNTRQDAVWNKRQQVSMKGRHPLSKPEVIGPGPAGYQVSNYTLGTQPNYSLPTIKGRNSLKCAAGLPSALQLPSESSGYVNAEEQFLLDQTVKSCRLGDAPKWSISGRRDSNPKSQAGSTLYSRPTDYHRHPAPGKTFAKRLPLKQDKNSGDIPAPNHYLVPMNDKPRLPRAVVIPRRDHNSGTDAPAPNEYAIRGAYDKCRRTYDWRGPNITFRGNYSGEVQPEKLPGPNEYHPYNDELVKGGTIGTGSKLPTMYPECLQYKPHLKSTKITPAAAEYHPKNYCITNNTAPKYSFGNAAKRKAATNAAGPGDYNVRGLTRKGFSSGPKFSLGLANTTGNGGSEEMPAPGDYNTTVGEKGKGWTMPGRISRAKKNGRKPKRGVRNPGPRYNVAGVTRTGPLNCGKTGVSLKSRWSPHVYAGAAQELRLKSNQVTDIRWVDHIKLG